jgi:hypothetical protein
MSTSGNEVKKIREMVSQLTGARFEIREAENLPSRFKHVKWFMRCREITQASKIPYANSIWEEDGEIWMESLTIGNSLQMIELTYGEKAAATSTHIDYSGFETKEFQTGFARKYPLVFHKIQIYETIATQVSKKRGLQLKLAKESSEGIIDFAFAAKLASDSKISKERFEEGVQALKEAWEQVAELEASGT